VDQCCREFEQAARLSRRRLLAGMAATGGAAVATSVFGSAFRQAAFADTTTGTPHTGNNVLVVLSLRGGIDGMGLVVPHGDPGYYAARPTIALPAGSLVAPDEMFGLHPQMAPLQWLWDSGELAAVHAVGLAVPNRSHFSAMEEVEDADPASATRRGWVNRMIGLDDRNEPSEAVNLTGSVLPTMLSGPAPALAADSLDQITMVGAEADEDPVWARRRRNQLNRMWGNCSTTALLDAYRSARSTVDLLAPVAGADYTPTAGVTYPRAWPGTDLADALKDTARLIKADVGTDVVSIDFGSWDMHSDYGTTEYGRMQSMAGALAGVLDAFMRDLGPTLRQRVTLVTISEFGRRLHENGNRGLDHGWGNMMLVAGAGVDGGKYHASWPGLGDGTQTDADLQVTTDYRNVFAEILSKRFPDRSVADVFPGLSYSPLGVMRAA
jgi:uncharacterized protein (DUF1501 family)